MNYARVQDDVVAEVFEVPADRELGEFFTAEVAAMFEPCGPKVKAGWARQGKSFAPAGPVVRPEPKTDDQSLDDLKRELEILQAKIDKALAKKK